MYLGLGNKSLKEKGLTLIEALISTAIVGIGFIAVFQMVNYSIQSINTSGDRTKISYLSSMIVEDLIGDRFTNKGTKKIYKHLADQTSSSNKAWNTDCSKTTKTIYGTNNNAIDNKKERWIHRFQDDVVLNCRSGNQSNLKVFEICKDSVKIDGKTRANCDYHNNKAFDEIFIGRTEIEIATGGMTGNKYNTKKKYLYFQIN